MKSSWVTALTIVGVLATATAATAINADTLKGIDGGTIGNAIEVLVPVVSSSENPAPGAVPGSSVAPTEPNATVTTSPESSSGGTAPRTGSPASNAPVAVVPDTSVSTGTSGSSSADETSSGDGSSDDGVDGDSNESGSSGSSDDD